MPIFEKYLYIMNFKIYSIMNYFTDFNIKKIKI